MNVFGITHRGAVRNENQDRFRYSLMGGGELLTAVLCDGMEPASHGSQVEETPEGFILHGGGCRQ